MQSLITSYLLQSSECSLPGIGSLLINKIPAQPDKEKNEILPPSEEIVFSEQSSSHSSGLIKYIAEKKSIDINEAQSLFINFCTEWKEKINAGETFTLPGVGSIKKSDNDKIYFEKENSFAFYQPVHVEKIYQPSSDKLEKNEEEESGLIQENNFEEEVVTGKRYWGWWAAILFVIALAAIVYQLKDKKLTGSSAGNQTHIVTDSAAATYTTPH
jgi:hypothetical protein